MSYAGVPQHAKGVTNKKPSGWRVFLNVIADLLLTVGAIFLLFVVWQLWWTTFTVQSGMNTRIETFQAANPVAVEEFTEVRHYDDPPIMAEPEYGAVMGVLHVPKWDQMAIPVQQGTDAWILDTGNAGHYVDTALPGEIGNAAFAGHRRTYGNNFRQVHIMEPGDAVVFETDEAWLVYKVFDHEIVLPTQIEVLYPVPNEPNVAPTKRILTMTTCDPEFGNSHRFILYSEFAYWVAKSDGIPEVLER